MGRQLDDRQPTFRKALDKCNEILLSYLEQPLLSVLYPESGNSSLLQETIYTQPALFALEYALAELWRSWGIEPAAVMGHSLGEDVAACVAGVFSLEDGLKLVAARGRLMQSLPDDGEMVAVFADESRVRSLVDRHVRTASIAALNGPESLVISGHRQAVRSIVEDLRRQGVRVKAMMASRAFHSPSMDAM